MKRLVPVPDSVPKSRISELLPRLLQGMKMLPASRQRHRLVRSWLRTVVNQRLTGSHVICEKYRKNANGTFTCYVCVELASEDVLAALNSSISDDSKLRIDYDYEKFKKIFEEEMSKAQ